MSDDLVKRLYDRRVCSPAQNYCCNDWALDQAADRIEELEAKLARVVELALEECPFRWGTPNYDKWWHHRRTTIAELKGQADE